MEAWYVGDDQLLLCDVQRYTRHMMSPIITQVMDRVLATVGTRTWWAAVGSRIRAQRIWKQCRQGLTKVCVTSVFAQIQQ